MTCAFGRCFWVERGERLTECPRSGRAEGLPAQRADESMSSAGHRSHDSETDPPGRRVRHVWRSHTKEHSILRRIYSESVNQALPDVAMVDHCDTYARQLPRYRAFTILNRVMVDDRD